MKPLSRLLTILFQCVVLMAQSNIYYTDSHGGSVQSAVSAAISAGGGEVYVTTPGQYDIGSTLVLGSSTSRVHLHLGENTHLRCTMTDASNCITVYDGSGLLASGPGYSLGALNNGSNGYISLTPTAHVKNVIVNAVTTGAQQSMFVDGIYIISNQTAIVDEALLHLKGLFSSTLVHNYTASGFANTIGLLIETPGSGIVSNITTVIDLQNIVINGGGHAGARPMVIRSNNSGTIGDIWCKACNLEAPAPGGAAVEINGNGGAAIGNHVSDVSFYGLHLEAANTSAGAAIGLKIVDADNVRVYGMSGAGCSSCTGSATLIDISESGTNRTYNISVDGVSNINWPTVLSNHITQYSSAAHELTSYTYTGHAWNGEVVPPPVIE